MKKLALLLLVLAVGSGCAAISRTTPHLRLPYDKPVPMIYVVVVNEELDADVKSPQ